MIYLTEIFSLSSLMNLHNVSLQTLVRLVSCKLILL